jgi:RNA polymerase sigma factor (sigma-70 family)
MRRTRWWGVVRLGELPHGASSDDRSAERLDLDAALDRLPQQQLLVLSLYYHLDLPIEEVARVLGCSPGAARERIHRALAALRPGMAIEVDA